MCASWHSLAYTSVILSYWRKFSMRSTILSSRTFSTALAFIYTRSGGPMDASWH